MLVSLTVGKVDAGVAVLLTEDKRLIEFPSILLPPDIHSGSIVDINVSRNQAAEQATEQKFAALQDEIHRTFGTQSPAAPVLRCRNATQTSVVLEWDALSLATASLRSLSLYRNGAKAGVIPPDKRSTKISGLALDTEYTFQLVLRTSAGTLSSERLTVRTHRMTDLTGITVTPGIMAAPLRESLAATLERIGARLADTVRIDTTHFVCTEPRGHAWEKAVEMNVPVVVPDWVKGCEREGRIVGVRGYYLDADPKLRQIGPSRQQQQQQPLPPTPTSNRPETREGQQYSAPRIEHTPPTPDRAKADGEFRGQSSDEEDDARTADGVSEVDGKIEPTEVDDSDSDEDDHDVGSGGSTVRSSAAKPTADGADGATNGDDGGFDEVAL